MNTSLTELLRSARWAIRLAWNASAALLTAVLVNSTIRGLLPAALAVTARGIVNAALATGTAGIGPMMPWLIVGFCFTVVDGITGLAVNMLKNRLRDDLNCHITADILQHAAALDVPAYENPDFHDVLQRAKDNPAGHVTNFLVDLIGAGSNAVQIVSLVALLVSIEPSVVVVAVLFAVPFLRFQWGLAAQHYALERSRTTKRRWTGYFVATLTSVGTVAEVKLLRLGAPMLERFRTLMAEFRDQDRHLYVHNFSRSSLFVVFTSAAFYLVFVRVAYRVLAGAATLGDLAIFGGATARLRWTLENCVFLVTGAMGETLYIANIIEFLEMKPSEASPISDGVGRDTVAMPRVARDGIELRDVGFTYPGAAQPALAGISLRIAPGETIALVGENGAGKTTLVKLIARLYDASEGGILFDGIDVRTLPRDEVQRRIAFVFQGFGRYEATAADNIAYGDWERLLDNRARVQEVARMADVDAMIGALPHGYDTLLGRTFGERELSAGQWQKIAIARAFARDADLLILDEPTSNLDARAEHALFMQFRSLAKGRTTIIVSHRFTTVSMAHRIVVLDKGRIVEAGTHAELVARAGNYADLYALQQRVNAG
jgi:ABC-type multidrug transport system fused ATPase/permease subunit